MFEQNPTLGPGIGTSTTHTLEILLMLAGAFLLGLWLGWLLWSRFKAMYDQLLLEHESTKLSLEAANVEVENAKKRTTQMEADTLTLRGRIDSISADYHDSEARLQHLGTKYADLTASMNAIESKYQVTESAESAPKIEFEVIESPVDVHVEDLAATTIPAESFVAVSPEIEVVADNSSEILPIIDEPTIEIIEETPVLESEILEVSPIVTAESTDSNQPIVEESAIVNTSIMEAEKVELAAEIKETAEKTEIIGVPVTNPSIFVPAASADNLQIVEGIGPKIEQVLNMSGILTFRQLAGSNETQLREILAVAGSRYRMHDPSTWPEQSKMAEIGDWENLKKWQDQLKSGKGEAFSNGEKTIETASVLDTLTTENLEITSIQTEILPVETIAPVAILADDLKKVEGIGPKIQELLAKSNISTFNELAATPVARLKEILEAAGNRYAIHDPGTWPAQALLAANGEWDNLKAYQGFLNAGKRPE